MKAFWLLYRRHGNRHNCILYAPNENKMLEMLPDDLVITRIRRFPSVIDIPIRFLQRNLMISRFKNRRLMSLFDTILNSLVNVDWDLNSLLQESILSGHMLYLQYEYCVLFHSLESGNPLSQSLVRFSGIPSHILTMIGFVEKGVDFVMILKNCIAYFEIGVKRNYSFSKYFHFASFLIMLEVLYASFLAQNELKDYFYYFRMVMHEPPMVAKYFYELFTSFKPREVVTTFFKIYAVLFLIRFLYSMLKPLRWILDFIKLYMPIYSNIEYLRCQLNVFYAIKLADETMMSYTDSLDIIGRQIDNIFLLKRWQKVRAEREVYSEPVTEMVNQLFANSKTMARLNKGQNSVGSADIELIDMDLKHKIFIKDMIVFAFAMFFVVGLPIWSMVSVSMTQYEFWMVRLRSG
ncbi:MAG: hypothetical protein CMF46_00305 [Legionellales bacterium]|nr:hypothetical protein [Legionellales bacterium]